MKVRLTDDVAAKLTVAEGKSDAILSDDRIPGFTIRAMSSGRKFWRLRYKIAGEQRRVILGEFPGMTAAKARKAAEGYRGQVSAGKDIWAEAQAERERRAREAEAAAFTVAVLIDEWQADRLSGRSASYRAEAPKRLRIALGKYLKQPAASLDRTAAVQALTLAKRESGPVAANRIRAYARACFGWAVKRGSVPTNPFADVPVPAEEVARDRVLSDDELALVWVAAETLSPPFRALVKLLILTGQRRGEVAGMRWSELNLDGDTPHWTLPADRTKNGRAHDVPLSPEAVAVLAASPRIVGNDFVLSTGPKAAPSGFGKVKERLDAHIAKAMAQGNGSEGVAALAPWTLHDLRRTVATGLQRLGVRLEVTEAVLNHVSGTRTGIVGVYQRHQWTDEKRAALTAWAQHVNAIVTPAEAADKVASLAAERLRRNAAA